MNPQVGVAGTHHFWWAGWVVDPFSVGAAQLAAAQSWLVTSWQVVAIMSRTDLIEGSEHMAEIDRDIAAGLRRPGSWSKNRLRDMVDATIFRRYPELVPESREDAENKRGVWNNTIGDEMSALEAVGSAEKTGLIVARLKKLAMPVCTADPRRKSERMADGLFALVMGREFSCQCPHDPTYPCTAKIWMYPADHLVSGVDVKVVLHVIADQATVGGEADNPGHLQGHGVTPAPTPNTPADTKNECETGTNKPTTHRPSDPRRAPRQWPAASNS